MEFNSKTRALTTFVRDVEKGKYNMNHKLQRQEGQWNALQRSELIDSLLRSYPIDPIRCEVKDGINYIFDGVQRSTNLRDYFSDGFKLHKNLNPVTIDGKTYLIAGKKYSQLDEAVQDKLKSCEIQVYLFTDCTDEDVKEMFRRQNGGKVLSNLQKRSAMESNELGEIVFNLASHPFFTKVLGKTQLKRDLQKDIIREVIMLTETNAENDFTSFKSKDIDSFLIWYQDYINEDKIDLVKQSLDKLDESFEELKINVLSIPMIIFAGYRTLKDKKSFASLVDKINNFVANYDTNEEYKQYCQGGTTAQVNVRGRLDYWRNILRTM